MLERIIQIYLILTIIKLKENQITVVLKVQYINIWKQINYCWKVNRYLIHLSKFQYPI
jgi:hypothetical protein